LSRARLEGRTRCPQAEMRALVNLASAVSNAQYVNSIVFNAISQHIWGYHSHLSRTRSRWAAALGKFRQAAGQSHEPLPDPLRCKEIERFDIGYDGFEVFGRFLCPDHMPQINRRALASAISCQYPMT
jgi:hypothetical protein